MATKVELVQQLLGTLAEIDRENEAKKEDAKSHRENLKSLKEREESLRAELEVVNPMENMR